MTHSPNVGSFEPEDVDGAASKSTGENGAATNGANQEAHATKLVRLDIADPHFMPNAYDT
jgi:hypothetical protein